MNLLTNISQTEIEKIYKKAMIQRSQKEQEIQKRRQEELEKNFWNYAYSRIENLLHGIMQLYEMPTISKQQIDQAQKEFSEFLDLVNQNTLPEVIDELIYRESKARQLKKLEESN